MTEKTSLAGNNILSQVEYDAVLSHAGNYSLNAWANSPEVLQIWTGWLRPGEALSHTQIDAAIEAMEAFDVIGSRSAEAQRIMNAIRTIFGRETN